MTAREIMTTEVVTIREEATVREAAELLLSIAHDAVPVVSAGREVLGVISYEELIRLVLPEPFDDLDLSVLPPSAGFFPAAEGPEQLGDLKVRDVMRRDPVQQVPADEPVAEIARLMLTEQAPRVVVVEGGKLVGIVSRGDIVRAIVHPRLGGSSLEMR